MPRFSTRYRLPQAPVAAPVLPNLSQQNAANARLAQFPLEEQARQAQIDRANAAEAKARYDLGKQIETDRQTTAFYNGLQELESNLNARGFPVGTKEHAEAFAAYAHEVPLARSSADVQKTLKVHALVADDQAALKQRINALSPPPEKIAQRYAKVQGDIATFSGDPTKTNDLNGALIESDNIEKSYPQLKVPTLPQQTVYPDDGAPSPAPGIQLAAGYGQPVAAASPTTVQPSATPDQTPIYTPSPSPEATQTPAIPTAHSKDEYDAIPAGAQFMSNGNLYVKPQATPDAGE